MLNMHACRVQRINACMWCTNTSSFSVAVTATCIRLCFFTSGVQAPAANPLSPSIAFLRHACWLAWQRRQPACVCRLVPCIQSACDSCAVLPINVAKASLASQFWGCGLAIHVLGCACLWLMFVCGLWFVQLLSFPVHAVLPQLPGRPEGTSLMRRPRLDTPDPCFAPPCTQLCWVLTPRFTHLSQLEPSCRQLICRLFSSLALMPLAPLPLSRCCVPTQHVHHTACKLYDVPFFAFAGCSATTLSTWCSPVLSCLAFCWSCWGTLLAGRSHGALRFSLLVCCSTHWIDIANACALWLRMCACPAAWLQLSGV